MVLIYILIIFFLFLIAYQIVLGMQIHKKEGFDITSDLDKLDRKVDNVRADVFDLSINLVALQKNVATLINQQTGFAASLKNSASDIPVPPS